jgi:hypothetical protein
VVVIVVVVVVMVMVVVLLQPDNCTAQCFRPPQPKHRTPE